jgi:hypothetical protein
MMTHKTAVITAETMRRLVEACLDDRLRASSSACVHDRARCQVAKGGGQLCVRLGPPPYATTTTTTTTNNNNHSNNDEAITSRSIMELVILEGAVQCKPPHRLANVVAQGGCLPGDDGVWLRIHATAAGGAAAGEDGPFWLELQVPLL